MTHRKNEARKLRDRRRPKKGRICLAVAVIACLVVFAYFFWPRIEYISVRGGAAIVDSFYSSSPDFTDKAMELLRSKGINVDVYKDGKVTVELYRQLPRYGYNLIILRVHAGILGRDPTSPTFLFTNEPYSPGEYFSEQLSDQVLSGVVGPDSSEKPVFTVGPQFIAASEGNFNNSIVILSSCLGLFTDQLANAFNQKGAKAFIGWDKKVSLSHTDEACTQLLQDLINERMNIGQALDEVMAKVGPDQTYGSILKHYPQEAGNLKLEF